MVRSAMGVILALKEGVTKHNKYKRQSTNGKWNRNNAMAGELVGEQPG